MSRSIIQPPPICIVCFSIPSLVLLAVRSYCSNTIAAQKFTLGKAAQGRDEVAEALTGLQKDIEFWRRIARNSTMLISKLISISMISTDIRFAAELGTVRTLSAKETALLQNVLSPFDACEAALATAFKKCSNFSMLNQLNSKIPTPVVP